MSGILSADLPAGWRRCHALGCGAPSGHEPPHVPEAVPPVAVAGPEVDVAAEVGPTRAERIEAAARALLCEIERWQRVEVVGFGIPSAPLPIAALRAALCSCTGHGPDLACVEHGEALRAWQKENGT